MTVTYGKHIMAKAIMAEVFMAKVFMANVSEPDLMFIVLLWVNRPATKITF